MPIRRSSVMDIKMRRRGPSSSGQWCAGRLAEKRGSFSEACRYILSTHCAGNITNLDRSEFNITLNCFHKIEPSGYFHRIFIFQERRIFDSDQRKFSSNGLHFRHTDNINFFLRAAMDIGLPEVWQILIQNHVF